MNNLKLSEIINVCKGTLLTKCEDVEIEFFCKDTRIIKPGDMYVAIKGEKFDGNSFIEDALNKGAIGCIIDTDIQDELIEKFKDRAIIKVDNSLKAIQDLATYRREQFNIPVVAVTGSVGKTSTKDIIASVLSEKYKVLKTEGNQNNDIGLPFTILKLKDHTAAVIEMGMNHFGEISLLTKIVKPTIGVITNIGTSHIGNLGSRENIMKAKLEILEGMDENGTLVINNDNDLLSTLENLKCTIIRFGIDSENSDYKAESINLEESGSDFYVNRNKENIYIEVPVGGKHFVYNGLCATAVGLKLGLSVEQIKNGISNFCLTAKRMEIKKIKNNVTIINDTYNASYDSMKAVLEYIASISADRRIAVLGDMLELGEYSKDLHEKVGEEVAKNKIDILVTVGENAKFIANKAKEQGVESIYICNSCDEATEVLNKIIKANDTIVFKASNAMKLGDIITGIS